MKNQKLAHWSIVLALLLIVVTAHSVLAYDPPTWPQGLPWANPTVMPWPTPRPLSIGESWSPTTGNYIPAVVNPLPGPSVPPYIPISPVANPVPMPVVQPQSIVSPIAGGMSPSTALNPSGAWQLLDSGTSIWYRIGHGGVQIEVFLDLDPASNVSLSIYAPNQLNRPVGKGTPYQRDPSRLVWSGGHWNSDGDWLAQVINYNPMPVHYRITSSARDISNKTCESYWEYIGPNHVFWTACK